MPAVSLSAGFLFAADPYSPAATKSGQRPHHGQRSLKRRKARASIGTRGLDHIAGVGKMVTAAFNFAFQPQSPLKFNY
jgi:hypothetical protein